MAAHINTGRYMETSSSDVFLLCLMFRAVQRQTWSSGLRCIAVTMTHSSKMKLNGEAERKEAAAVSSWRLDTFHLNSLQLFNPLGEKKTVLQRPVNSCVSCAVQAALPEVKVHLYSTLTFWNSGNNPNQSIFI